MRTLKTVLVLTPLVLLGVISPGPAAAAASKCKVTGSKTVRQNPNWRLYEKTSGEETTLYTCNRSTGRKTAMAVASDDGLTNSQAYADVRLNGNFAGWTYTVIDNSCKANCPPDYDSTTVTVSVYNLATRKIRRVAVEPLPNTLVVGVNGSAAWILTGTTANTLDIQASVRAGEAIRTIDSGAIDSQSLAIEQTIISWTRDGAERFARLR